MERSGGGRPSLGAASPRLLTRAEAADEAEDFQAVGMRCREALPMFARATATDEVRAELDGDAPKGRHDLAVLTDCSRNSPVWGPTTWTQKTSGAAER